MPAASRPAPSPRASAASDPASPFHRMLARLPEAPDRARRRLIQAGDALARGDHARAETSARRAVTAEGGPLAWRFIGLAREQDGALVGALAAYQTAHDLAPGDPDALRDLARMARRLNQPGMAAELLAHVRAMAPGDPGDARDLAAVLRDLDRCGEALDVVRDALARAPDDAYLWTLLGAIAAQNGDDGEAMVFHEEAVRLAPRAVPILHNLALARLQTGDAAGARDACDAALAAKPTPPQAATVRLARASARLRLGDLAGGWSDYGARLDPARAESLAFDLRPPRWTPSTPLGGARLLLVGEQGLGDEVMFGGVVGDVLEALGPAGRLTLAVEPRLVGLFAQAFPDVLVLSHATLTLAGRLRRTVPGLRADAIDLWAPLGDMLPVFRAGLERFAAGAYLPGRPDQIARWRETLDGLGDGPRIGIIWKSRLMTGLRTRGFAPFETWAPVLRTPGVVFVNLQYGGTETELAWAARDLGVQVVQPDLDLMADLDGLAGLCGALDLVIGAPTATTNLAAAGGTETWMICAPDAWPTLGTGGYPWYPNARAFLPRGRENWDQRMERVATTLEERAASGRDARNPADTLSSVIPGAGPRMTAVERFGR
jgi:Flp pilus assembly protein TadD